MKTFTVSVPSTRNEVTQSLRDLVTQSRITLAMGIVAASVLALKGAAKLAPKSPSDIVTTSPSDDVEFAKEFDLVKNERERLGDSVANPHCLKDGKPCAPGGDGNCVACDLVTQ